MSRTVNKLTLEEFLALPEAGDRYELVNGELKPKMSPKFKHSQLQLRLLMLLNQWCEQEQTGRVLPEWAIVLKRRGADWVPVPDLTYVSYQRLPAEWEEDEPCPVLPEVVIEIISPGQRFGELTQKAEDYLKAGIEGVWVVDSQAQSVTVFRQNALFETLGMDQVLSDELLPGLEVKIAEVFQ